MRVERGTVLRDKQGNIRYQVLQKIGAGRNYKVVAKVTDKYEKLPDMEERPAAGKMTIKKDAGIFFLRFAHEDEQEDKREREEDKDNPIKYLKREGNFQMYYPNIAHVYETFEGYVGDKKEDSIFCVVQEYIEGEDLLSYFFSDAVRNRNYETNKKIFRWMLQLLRSTHYYLNYVTDGDPFVHRDLKPDNLMIDKDGRVKVVDFDWARIPNSTATQNSTICGTKGYADPDAYHTDHTREDMDIYSLGRIFCFMLRGGHYFTPNERGDATESEEKGGKKKTEENKNKYFLIKPVYGDVTEDQAKRNRELAYGFEEDRILPCYLEDEFKGLREIIQKMVTYPHNRYKKIKDVLKDFDSFVKAFLKNKYKENESEFRKEYRDITEDEMLLRVSLDGKTATIRPVFSWEEDGKTYRGHDYTCEERQIVEIREDKVKKSAIMDVYYMDGKIKYILGDNIHKKTVDNGILTNGDIFEGTDSQGKKYTMCVRVSFSES